MGVSSAKPDEEKMLDLITKQKMKEPVLLGFRVHNLKNNNPFHEDNFTNPWSRLKNKKK